MSLPSMVSTDVPLNATTHDFSTICSNDLSVVASSIMPKMPFIPNVVSVDLTDVPKEESVLTPSSDVTLLDL
jgi:hypothetical protein